MARRKVYEPQDQLFLYMDAPDQHEEDHEVVRLFAERVLDELLWSIPLQGN